MAITAPTTNSLMVLEFLKRNFGREVTKREICDNLGISMPAVSSSINNLVKKGFVTERLEEIVEPATETKKEKVTVLRHETLTEAGLAYDPMAEYEAKKAAAQAEKEAKAAAKAAKAAEVE